MNVTIMGATPAPIAVISLAAGNCYGKHDVSEKRIRNCVKAGHTSILEHASVTFSIEGVSRACMAQLTRHRMASFCIESQRYCKYDRDFFYGSWYVTPPAFKEDESLRTRFIIAMRESGVAYRKAIKDGVKPEDARYLLPEATKTNIVMTMNLREIFHFFDLRLDKAAQWEIRDLAALMREAVENEGQEWRELMQIYDAAKENSNG